MWRDIFVLDHSLRQQKTELVARVIAARNLVVFLILFFGLKDLIFLFKIIFKVGF